MDNVRKRQCRSVIYASSRTEVDHMVTRADIFKKGGENPEAPQDQGRCHETANSKGQLTSPTYSQTVLNRGSCQSLVRP